MRSSSWGTMDSTATTRQAVSTSWIGLRCAPVAARMSSGVLPGQARWSTRAANSSAALVALVALVPLVALVALLAILRY